MSKKKEEKKQTIPEIVEEVKTAICDEYCKFPDVLDEEVLWSNCEKCPLGRL